MYISCDSKKNNRYRESQVIEPVYSINAYCFTVVKPYNYLEKSKKKKKTKIVSSITDRLKSVTDVLKIKFNVVHKSNSTRSRIFTIELWPKRLFHIVMTAGTVVWVGFFTHLNTVYVFRSRYFSSIISR